MNRLYDLEANWPKVEPHVEHPDVQAVLARDLNVYLASRHHSLRYNPDEMYPIDCDDTDWGYSWRFADDYAPDFWFYTVCHACHWLVNFNLLVAQRAEPDRPWRIMTSDGHSTVWDGDQTVFDFNDLAMGVTPPKDFEDPCWKELRPGELMPVFSRGIEMGYFPRRHRNTDH